MGGSKKKKRAAQREEELAKAMLAIAKQREALFQQAFQQVSPFATAALGVGQQALAGQAPDYFRKAVRNQISGAFDQNRQNLVDFFGRSGQGISGLAAGPLNYSFADEARSIGDAETQAILQALGIGFQGGNLLMGQQALLDPGSFFQGSSQANNAILQANLGGFNWGGLLGGLIGAGLAPFTGGLSLIGTGASLGGGFGGNMGGGM